MEKRLVLGLMSGTSLDGLDMALCEFEAVSGTFTYIIKAAETIEYSAEWREKLTHVKLASAEAFFKLHAAYGTYLAEQINIFLNKYMVRPDLIASHGHTVFHQPQLGFSTQLGCGATLAAKTNLPTVCDFRSTDVALGGQGAPLVPIGDKYLFREYAACLNIGGIANISYTNAAGVLMAYDLCEANMLLNLLAERAGKAYDKDGIMARAGNVDQKLLEELNGLHYYSQTGAKSIGREWFETDVESRLQGLSNTENLLATCTEHVADIIAGELNRIHVKNVLVTGGGACNVYLMERIQSKTVTEIILPSKELIHFKEALIFAFLGYLRLNNNINVLNSVTGASRNCVAGALYLG